MSMRLFLIFHGRFPSEKAASIFAAESSATFASEGYETTLLLPRRKGVADQDPYAYYNVPQNFRIVFLSILDIFGSTLPRAPAFWLSYISFSISTLFYLLKKSVEGDIIYSNEILPLGLISFSRKNCFYEMHDFPESKRGIFGWILGRMRWILIHNKWKLEETKKLFPNVSSDKFLYEPNAVSINDFNIPISQEEVRLKLGLLAGEKFVIYTGHLYSWKGVDTLAESVAFLPKNYHIFFIGGTSQDIAQFTQKYGGSSQISIMGHVPHSEIPLWQRVADVLVLPNTAKEKISALYTSPMKLFEYMASSRPIVATRIPSLCEILNDKNAILVEADDAKALARGIKKAVEEGETSRQKQALKDVANFTWEKRAQRIIAFMNV